MESVVVSRGRVRWLVGRMTDADLLTLCYRVRVDDLSVPWIISAQAEAFRRGLYAEEYVANGLGFVKC